MHFCCPASILFYPMYSSVSSVAKSQAIHPSLTLVLTVLCCTALNCTVLYCTVSAKGAAQRREAQGRAERQWREERKAQWMASLRGPGWARSGRCHSLY